MSLDEAGEETSKPKEKKEEPRLKERETTETPSKLQKEVDLKKETSASNQSFLNIDTIFLRKVFDNASKEKSARQQRTDIVRALKDIGKEDVEKALGTNSFHKLTSDDSSNDFNFVEFVEWAQAGRKGVQKIEVEERSFSVDSVETEPKPKKTLSLKERLARYTMKKAKSEIGSKPEEETSLKSRLENVKSKQETSEKYKRRSVMDHIPLTDITRLHCIGVGCFGSVYVVQRKSSQKYYALKRLSKGLLAENNITRQLFQEKNCMLELDSPFFVKLFSTTQTQQHLILIMDLVDGGEFFHYLLTKSRFPEHQAIFYATNVILAFEHMHERGIIYRDLKPENLMFDATGYLKMIDFGFSKKIDDGTTDTFCGTPEYMAPEVLREESHSYPYDWWTLGVLFYEMVGGISPFKQPSQEKIFEKIKQVKFGLLPWFSELTKSFVSGVLKSEPQERIGVSSNVRSHPIFKGQNWEQLKNQSQVPPYVPMKQTPNKSNAPVPFVEYKPDQETEALFAGF